MNRKIQKEIIAFCEKYQMFQTGDGIVIGLSGGADSVCLTYFLDSIREQYALKLYAVHVHHGIRGAEADQDEAFAEKCAERLGIPYESVKYDIPALAKQHGMSEEEAGRFYRYQYFREVVERRGCKWIAVAHHRDDQAETVLFHLLRGSGLRGMGGIRPVQNGIIRPLLAVSRQEIEQELRAEGIDWREDATNQECQYARNKLRNEVIPYLRREIQPEAVSHIAETALQLQEAWGYMSRQVKLAAEQMAFRGQGKIRLKRSAFLELDPALQPYVLLNLIEELAGNRKDIGKVHIRALMDLIQGDTGRRISLPYRLQAGRDYEEIWLAKMADGEEEDTSAKPGKEADNGTGEQGKAGGKTENGIVEQRKAGEKTENGIVEHGKAGEKTKNRTGEQGKAGEKAKNRTGEQSGKGKETESREGKKRERPEVDTGQGELPVGLPGKVEIQRDLRQNLSDAIPKNHCTKWFDYAKIVVSFVWRHPMPGDYLVIDRQGHTKKLSRILLDQKIPREQRKALWVFADGDHVLWVPQIKRTSMGYYVTEETKEVLVVHIDGERWNTL